MLAIRIHFPAGRYHATPWGRHVNEADVEWPPSAWRLLRSMIAIWHRKVDHSRFPEPVLENLITSLAGHNPVYRLPPAIHAHTRHYMPVRAGKADQKALVFDAFLRLNPDDELIVAWPDAELQGEEVELLDSIVDNMGFLGRTESWVEAERLETWDNRLANCVPAEQAVESEAGETMEPARLLSPLAGDEYARWRERIVSELDLPRVTPKKKREALEKTTPETLLGAMRLETKDVRSAGWSRPPGAAETIYMRPGRFVSPGGNAPAVKREAACPDTCRLALAGVPLPLVEDSVRVGEWMRWAVMGKAKRKLGEDGIPFELSGHAVPKENFHGHAFFLPEDKTRDGRIDHILIHAPAGFSRESLQVLSALCKVWNKKGQEWRVLLEGIGEKKDFSGTCVLCAASTVWTSLTPYLHPWHVKKKFTFEDQVRRECRQRMLPEPEQVEILPEIHIGKGKMRRSVHFHRFRSKSGLSQPDTHGRFLRLVFQEPFQGPLALGFGCHFGLGLFGPGA